jgi:hypothetical protein
MPAVLFYRHPVDPQLDFRSVIEGSANLEGDSVKPKSMHVILGFESSQVLWSALLDTAVKKDVKKMGDTTYARLVVKPFSLEDRQFIHIRFDSTFGGEVSARIPRGLVLGIIDSEKGLAEGFYFSGKPQKI